MMAVIFIGSMSARSYVIGGSYNAAAVSGACQEAALRGLHYPVNADCTNWEAGKMRHMQYKPHTPPMLGSIAHLSLSETLKQHKSII